VTTDRAKRYAASWWRFFKAGYPTCCVSHAQYCWMVIWDVGETSEFSIKLSLS
jgi:hypothetical protein